MAMARTPARRRRPRRGSLERPINGRLYRGSLLILLLPLLILAFSITRPGALPAPLLPPNFDGPATRQLATELSSHYPDRVPGGPGSLSAEQWFRDQLAPYGLPVSSDTWRAHVPGLGRVRLRNLWAVAQGQSSDAIVVMAHRDDTGTGPGANDDASGTAALVELARGYAQAGTPAGQRVRSAHTIVFLSTDAGSFGGLGALRFAKHSPFHVVATINLDAIAGRGPPRIVIAGDSPRSPAASLVETAAKRVLEQTGTQARRAGPLQQLIDLGFPFTLYEQGPFVARGVPAVTLTTAGERPPAAFTDRATTLDTARLTGLGRATQELIGSLDQGLELAQGTTSFVWIGDRIVRGWAIELFLVALLIPYLVAVVDLFAHCRRRRIGLLPAARSLRSRLAFWLFLGLAFLAFRSFGAWPSGVPRPPNPAVASSGDWPVLGLVALALVGLLGWLVARQRLVPRRSIGADEQLAGATVALLGLGIVSLLVLATNPFALIFFLPAMHAWLWLPQVQSSKAPTRAVVFLIGLVGPLLIILSLALRFGLGFDAPWYLLELVAVGYVHLPAVVITLCGAACAAQLAVVTAGRYAPYPPAGQRPERGPLRELVRRVVLAQRARRRRAQARRPAVE
jgi:aminopeptidase YwaD